MQVKNSNYKYSHFRINLLFVESFLRFIPNLTFICAGCSS